MQAAGVKCSSGNVMGCSEKEQKKGISAPLGDRSLCHQHFQEETYKPVLCAQHIGVFSGALSIQSPL